MPVPPGARLSTECWGYPQIVNPRWIGPAQGFGEKVGMLLVIPLDADAVAWPDHRAQEPRRIDLRTDERLLLGQNV
jgi:hypothetical protein